MKITYQMCVEVAEKFQVNIERNGKKINLWNKEDHSIVTECDSVGEAWVQLHSDHHPMNRSIKNSYATDLLVESKIRKAQEQNAKLQAKRLWLLDHVGDLLQFVEHSRTSCSDEKPINASDDPKHSRCVRCQLLRIMENDWNDGWILDVSLSFQEDRTIDPVELKHQIQSL